MQLRAVAENGESPTVAHPSGRSGSIAIRLCRALVWLYSGAIVLSWLSLRLWGDRWWWATLLLFGPRWLLALPITVLAPAAAFLRPRLLWPLAGGTIFLSFAVLGMCAPWSALLDSKPGQSTLRVVTYNVDLGRSGLPELDRLIDEIRPDVVALQECSDELAPKFLADPAWRILRKRNLWLASRHPIEEEQSVVDSGLLGYWGTIAMRCRLETPLGRVHVVNVHLETPREGLDAILSGGLAGRSEMQADIERRAKISALASRLAGEAPRTLVLGDFNMPADSSIYRRDWSRFTNAFSRAGWGFGGSKMTRWFSVRIDHALGSDDWQAVRAWLGPRLGSDHRPLIAEWRLAE